MPSQKRSSKWWTKIIKSQRFIFYIKGVVIMFVIIVFRQKSGLCQRKRWLLLRTLFMSGARLPPETNKGCRKRLLIFCKGIKDSDTNKFLFSKIWKWWWRVWRRYWTSMRNQNLCQLSFTAPGLFHHISFYFEFTCFQENVPSSVCSRGEARREDTTWDNNKGGQKTPSKLLTYFI